MAARFNPHDKVLLAWLTSLSPRDELVTRYAIMTLSPRCSRSAEWKARAGDLRAMLKLGAGELVAVLHDANRMVEAFRAGAGILPPGQA
jgi:hypothetical protein